MRTIFPNKNQIEKKLIFNFFFFFIFGFHISNLRLSLLWRVSVSAVNNIAFHELRGMLAARTLQRTTARPTLARRLRCGLLSVALAPVRVRTTSSWPRWHSGLKPSDAVVAQCKFIQIGTHQQQLVRIHNNWYTLVQISTNQYALVQSSTKYYKSVQINTTQYKLVQGFAT